MDAITMLKERRSVRNFTNEKVDKAVIADIIETATYAPSWANFQIVRYTVVEDATVKARIGSEGYNGFEGNIGTLNRAAGVVVISYVDGKSGFGPNGENVSSKGNTWGMFDAGVATHQFCLAAYEKGVGTVIQGIFNEEKIAEIIDLPKDQVVAAVIPYGYETQHPTARPRNTVSDVTRYL